MVSSVVQHSLLLGLKIEVPHTPAFLGVGPIGFWLPLALFPVPEVFVAGLCSCLSSVFSLSLDSSPVLNNIGTYVNVCVHSLQYFYFM